MSIIHLKMLLISLHAIVFFLAAYIYHSRLETFFRVYFSATVAFFSILIFPGYTVDTCLLCLPSLENWKS